MTTSAELLTESFERVHGLVHQVVDGLSPDELSHRVDGEANTIAWLVWHLTRIQDDHVAGVASHGQVWTTKGFASRFGLPFDDSATGYGQSSDDVAAVRVDSGELLVDYYDEVHQQTIAFVGHLSDADLDRVVDEAWDPPVTLAARLISVISDDLQHVGQAAFVRGLI